MKNIMILTLLLIFAVGCKSECVKEVPVVEEAPVEVAPAVTPEEVVE